MPRSGRIAFRVLGALAVLLSSAPLRAADEATGTFVVDGQTTILRYAYAVQEHDSRDPDSEYLTLLISDVPVAESDRSPAGLTALAQAGRLHAIKVRWSVGLDETAAIPYHAALRNNGQASAGNLVLDLRAYDGQRVEAHVRSRMVGQNWQYSARVKAAIRSGGAAELEPDAEDAADEAAPAPADAPAGRRQKLELGKLGYEYNEDTFVRAVKDGNVAAVRLFLEAGMSPDAKDAQGEHALVRAVTFCSYPPAADRTQVALALIAAKADVHARMQGYEAVPIWASEHCQAEVVAALIAAGANVNARAPGGATPLMMARMRGDRALVAMLQKAGAKDEGPMAVDADAAPPVASPKVRNTPAPRPTTRPAPLVPRRERTGPLGATDKPPQVDPAEAQRRVAERVAWFRQQTVEAYGAGGHTDARWDAAAREALEAAAQSWSQSPERPGNDEERAWRASERAVKAGCDDPLVRYVNARFYAVAAFESAEELEERLRTAATGLRDSRYAPYFKAMAQMRLAESFVENPVLLVRGPAKAQAALQAALALLPEVARDRHVPEPSLVSFVRALGDVARALEGDREHGSKRILAAFEADPRRPLLSAALLIDTAWDERGSKGIGETSEAQSAGFARRLDEADQQLALALAADPGNPALPVLALAIELGQAHGRERMEAWYQHGLKVDPGSYELRAAKLHYLEPHWYGSAEEMLAFGQELRAAGQWALRLPLVLVAAHFELAIESKDRDAYWAGHPQACQDVRSAFEPFLRRYPEAAYERSGFAAILCSCGAWADAQRQFEILGDDARTAPFFGRAGLSLKQAEAARRAQPRPRRR